MHLAILIGANPKTADSAARVRLRKGSWSLRFDGIKDSILIINVLTPRAAPYSDQNIKLEKCDNDPLELDVEHPTMIFIEWKYRGTEKAISINAHMEKEKQNAY